MLKYQITRNLLDDDDDSVESEIFFAPTLEKAFITLETFFESDRIYGKSRSYEIRLMNVV